MQTDELGDIIKREYDGTLLLNEKPIDAYVDISEDDTPKVTHRTPYNNGSEDTTESFTSEQTYRPRVITEQDAAAVLGIPPNAVTVYNGNNKPDYS